MTTLVGEKCARCDAIVVRPEIAIVCQSCHRTFIPVRWWHGVAAVGSIFVAIVLQVQIADPWIPLVVGLAVAQILFFAAVRSLDKKLLLAAASLLLIPLSISVVAWGLGFRSRFLPASIAWISVLCFAGLGVQLFNRWREVGKAQKLSTLRIFATFSIALSCLGVVLLMILSFVPSASEDAGIGTIRHMLWLRLGTLFLWLAYVGVWTISGTFERRIDVPQQADSEGIGDALSHVVLLGMQVMRSLALEFIKGTKEIIAVGRVALAAVGRSLLFLIAVTGLQISFCLLIHSYLRYMVHRETHPFHLAMALVLVLLMLPALFWSATVASFSEVLVVSSNTLAIPGLAAVICATFASWAWFSYEIFFRPENGANWYVFLTAAAVAVAVAAVLIVERKKGTR